MESGKKLFSKLWPLGSKETNQAELSAFGQGDQELPTEVTGSKRARLLSAVKSTVGWPISLIYNTTQKSAPENNASAKVRGEETIVDVDAKESKRLEQVTKEFLEKIKEYYSRDLLAALDKFIREFNTLPNMEISNNSSAANSMLDQSSDSDDLTHSKLDPLNELNYSNNNGPINTSHNANMIPEELQKERGNKVKDFVSMMIGRFLLNSYWRTDLTNQQSTDDLRECIERYIMAKIFKKAYVPNKTEDWKFAQLISSLQFIQPNHLDIKSLVHPELIEDCSDILTQINFYVIPKNKLNCISGCCLTIFRYLEALQAQSANKAAVSVDDFLPILVYIIIKTNPPSLISNMNYIEDYTPAEDLETSMTGYFFANLKIVISFIKQLANNPSKLSLTESDNGEMSEEWLREQKELLLKAIQPPEIKKEDDRGAWLFSWVPLLPFVKKRDANNSNNINNNGLTLTEDKSHLAASQFKENMTSEMQNEQDLLNSEISAPIDNEAEQKRLLKRQNSKVGLSTNDADFLQHYSFWNCLAEDVKPRDIPELLAEYKRLAWYEYTQKQKKKQKKNQNDQD